MSEPRLRSIRTTPTRSATCGDRGTAEGLRGVDRRVGELLTLNGDADIAAAVREAYASGGYRVALTKWAEELTRKSARTYVSPLDIAEVHARLGDREQTFAWL